jgi:hypothetical protein
MPKKASLTLVDPKDEADKLNKRFDELLGKTNKHGAKDTDIAEFRRFLRDNSEHKLWDRVSGVMALAEAFILEKSPLTPGINEVLRQKQAEIRERMGWTIEAPEMEKLLISHAALCWLRLGLVETLYTSIMSRDSLLKLCEYYEKRLSTTQKRFTRACETLEHVRKMARSTPALRLVGASTA